MIQCAVLKLTGGAVGKAVGDAVGKGCFVFASIKHQREAAVKSMRATQRHVFGKSHFAITPEETRARAVKIANSIISSVGINASNIADWLPKRASLKKMRTNMVE